MRRFASSQANERYLHERTTEALSRLYAMHWPNLQPVTARGTRSTAHPLRPLGKASPDPCPARGGGGRRVGSIQVTPLLLTNCNATTF